MTETALSFAQRLIVQAMNAVRAAAGSAAGDDELLSVLRLCEGIARQADGVAVETLADLERRGVFAERGYRSSAAALSNLVMLCRQHHRQIHSTEWIVRIREGPPEFVPPKWIDSNRTPRRRRALPQLIGLRDRDG
jgi:ATP/maltotriose-dependent transcriptional regulator MalT